MQQAAFGSGGRSAEWCFACVEGRFGRFGHGAWMKPESQCRRTDPAANCVARIRRVRYAKLGKVSSVL